MKQNGKRKRLMIGCGNHGENPDNDCKKGPKLNIKRYCIGISNKIFYIPTPHQVTHNQWVI